MVKKKMGEQRRGKKGGGQKSREKKMAFLPLTSGIMVNRCSVVAARMDC